LYGVKKNGKGHSSFANLHAVPPTREAFIESQFSEFYGEILVLSFHFSTQKTLDGKKIINKSLCPTALPENSKPALDFI